MRFSRCHLRSAFCCAAMFTAVGFAGCDNSCFVGFSNNGNGGVIVKAGNPAPTCSLSQANGTMNAVALKSPVCETCAPANRVEHVFVTLRSIQLRPSASDDTNSPDWVELAPHLANEPRQIDLMGNSMPVILVKSAIVPAGSYREVRLQFFWGPPTSAEELPVENACGETRWNCIVMADGHVEPLRLPGGVPELLILSQSTESESLVVVPDARMDLQLSLEPHQGSYFSSTEGWRPQNLLVGRATVVQQRSSEAENSTPN
jgi:Domain of unknown function (DUF4382)